jgi:hypothetical protein
MRILTLLLLISGTPALWGQTLASAQNAHAGCPTLRAVRGCLGRTYTAKNVHAHYCVGAFFSAFGRGNR